MDETKRQAIKEARTHIMEAYYLVKEQAEGDAEITAIFASISQADRLACDWLTDHEGEYVIYSTGRDDRVHEIQRVQGASEAQRVVNEHNMGEMSYWIESGHRPDDWAWIPARDWLEFKATIDEECDLSERCARTFWRIAR